MNDDTPSGPPLIDASPTEAAALLAEQGRVAFEDFIQQPIALEPRPRTLLVEDRRTVERGRPWHRLGWAIVGAVVVVLAVVGPDVLRNLSTQTAAFVVAALGIVLIRRGKPTIEHRDVPLLWIDSSARSFRVRESPDQRDLSASGGIDFDDVDEVLFAVRNILLPNDTSGATVQSVGVFLRLLDGTVWPVIPGTLARREAYNIASGIAVRLNVGVKQVGTGWTDGPPDVRPADAHRTPRGGGRETQRDDARMGARRPMLLH